MGQVFDNCHHNMPGTGRAVGEDHHESLEKQLSYSLDPSVHHRQTGAQKRTFSALFRQSHPPQES
jgi:hypothetical protein